MHNIRLFIICPKANNINADCNKKKPPQQERFFFASFRKELDHLREQKVQLDREKIGRTINNIMHRLKSP
jgi:hypothetical protein